MNGGPITRSEVVQLSVVIPARNEERHIGGTIARIHTLLSGVVGYEIILVDHGSTDATVAIAQELGAKVLVHPTGSIGALRNHGVVISTGSLLVFLDADVRLTQAWVTELPGLIQLLRARPRTITGSVCVAPANSSWIERCWFSPAGPNRFGHVGSGHFITSRSFFDELGGFDESLETGEDHEICARAVALGGLVENDQRLIAEHIGYPATIAQFLAREAWHGRGDFMSLRRVLHSKVALMTLAFLGLHLLVLVGLLLATPYISLGAALLIVLMCLAAALHKFRVPSISAFLTNTALFYLYFVGRSVSLVQALRLRRRPGQVPRSPAGRRVVDSADSEAIAYARRDRERLPGNPV